MPLTKTVDTADPPLNPHWVPRHIVVHQRPAELEVEAFGCSVSAEQHVGVACAKPAFC